MRVAQTAVAPSTDPREARGSERVLAHVRIERMIRAHFAFVWRVARRFGLGQADADDAAQRVMLIAARRLNDVTEEKERAFLYRVAQRVTQKLRLSTARRREEQLDYDDVDFVETMSPEQLLEQRQAQAQLDEILEQLEPDVRMPFILFEIEELTQVEIALALAIPVGTVASRLSRARKQFAQALARQERIAVHRESRHG